MEVQRLTGVKAAGALRGLIAEEGGMGAQGTGEGGVQVRAVGRGQQRAVDVPQGGHLHRSDGVSCGVDKRGTDT